MSAEKRRAAIRGRLGAIRHRRLHELFNGLRSEVATLRGQSATLWNDLQRAPLPALAPPRDLLGESPAEAIAASLERHAGTAQTDLLRELGADEVERMLRRDRYPLPAPEDREGYYGTFDLDYWLSGLGDLLLLRRIAEGLGRPLAAGQRVLDFGCASGRVLRHLHLFLPELDLYGVDIGCHNVEWARRHLPPEIAVAQGTVIPSLPFEDGAFDVIYAGSVFTHIDQFEEAWLLELRRVLASDGFGLLTIHPDRIWADLRDPGHPLAQTVRAARHRLDPPGTEPVTPEVFERPIPAERVALTNVEYPVNNVNVIHGHRWIRERWGRYFDVREIVEHAHGGHQDGVVVGR